MTSEAIKTQEDNNKLYIQMSKTNIDNYIRNNEYKKAFALTILVLERINANEKVEFVDYYSKQLNSIISSYV